MTTDHQVLIAAGWRSRVVLGETFWRDPSAGRAAWFSEREAVRIQRVREARTEAA